MKQIMFAISMLAVSNLSYSVELSKELNYPKELGDLPFTHCLDVVTAQASNGPYFDINYIKSHPELKDTNEPIHLPLNDKSIFKNKDYIKSVEASYFDDVGYQRIAASEIHIKFKSGTTYKSIPVTDLYYLASPLVSYTYFVSPKSPRVVSSHFKSIYAKETKREADKFPPMLNQLFSIPVLNHVFNTDNESKSSSMFGCFSKINKELQLFDKFDFNAFAFRVADYSVYNPDTLGKFWNNSKFIDINPQVEKFIETNTK